MKHQNWVTVALFESPLDCRAAEKYLNTKRFEARTFNDRVLQTLLFLCPPRLTYRLQVRAGAVKVVKDLLVNDPPPSLAMAIHCPSCGSLDVNYPQMTRKFLVPTLFLHFCIIFRFIDHECYCEHCRYVWHLEKPRDEAVKEAKESSGTSR